jgi:hypothetical protein
MGMEDELAAGLGVVHRLRSGQARQAAPKVATPVRLIGRVLAPGQVTVPAAWSTVKSSTVNPPATAGCSGLGLSTATCPAPAMASRRSPVPEAESPDHSRVLPSLLAVWVVSAARNRSATAGSGSRAQRPW